MPLFGKDSPRISRAAIADAASAGERAGRLDSPRSASLGLRCNWKDSPRTRQLFNAIEDLNEQEFFQRSHDGERRSDKLANKTVADAAAPFQWPSVHVSGGKMQGFGSTLESAKLSVSCAAELSAAVMKATRFEPGSPKEKHILRLMRAGNETTAAVDYVANKITLRLEEKLQNLGRERVSTGLSTNEPFAEDTLVVLKTLITYHRIIRDGAPAFRSAFLRIEGLQKSLMKLSKWSNKGKGKLSPRNSPRNGNSAAIATIAAAEAEFVRRYATFLTIRSTVYSTFKYEESPYRGQVLEKDELFMELPALHGLMETAIQVKGAHLVTSNGGVRRDAQALVFADALQLIHYIQIGSGRLKSLSMTAWNDGKYSQDFRLYSRMKDSANLLMQYGVPFEGDVAGREGERYSKLPALVEGLEREYEMMVREKDSPTTLMSFEELEDEKSAGIKEKDAPPVDEEGLKKLYELDVQLQNVVLSPRLGFNGSFPAGSALANGTALPQNWESFDNGQDLQQAHEAKMQQVKSSYVTRSMFAEEKKMMFADIARVANFQQ